MTTDDDDLTVPGTDEATDLDAAAEGPQNLYPNVFVFVRDFLAVVYARPDGDKQGFRWCRQWYCHPEAVARLEALWKAFEALRQDPGTGASVWWRDHADPCMLALTSAEGTFRRCTQTQHKTPPNLAVGDVPPSLLDDVYRSAR